MRTRRGRCLWTVTLVALLPAGAAEAATNCVPVTAGIDTSVWNTARGTFLGRAVGQTFRAVDTVISRITV